VEVRSTLVQLEHVLALQSTRTSSSSFLRRESSAPPQCAPPRPRCRHPRCLGSLAHIARFALVPPSRATEPHGSILAAPTRSARRRPAPLLSRAHCSPPMPAARSRSDDPD
jgi:hypothetical protein